MPFKFRTSPDDAYESCKNDNPTEFKKIEAMLSFFEEIVSIFNDPVPGVMKPWRP